MTIAKKLTFMVLTGLLGIAMMTALSLFQMRHIYDAGTYLQVNTVPSVLTLSEATRPLVTERVLLWQYAAADAAQRAEIDARLAQSRQQFDEKLRFYETNLISDDKDRGLVNAVRRAHADVEAVYERVIALSRQGKAAEAHAQLFANQGLITKKVGLAFSPNPEQLKMNLQGIYLGEDHKILG